MKEISEQVDSIGEGAFAALLAKTRDIILSGDYGSAKETDGIFSDFTNYKKQYEAIDRLLGRVDELGIDADVKEGLVDKLVINKVKDQVEREKNVLTYEQYVRSLDIGGMERGFYEAEVADIIARIANHIPNLCSSYPNLRDLIKYYRKDVFEVAKKLYWEEMDGLRMKSFKKDGGEFVQRKLNGPLISLPALEYEANVEVPTQSKRKKSKNVHSLYLESWYNPQEGKIEITMTYFVNSKAP